MKSKLIALLAILLAQLEVVMLAQNISLNELSTTNLSNYVDINGKPSNWLEIYNLNANPILLSDYYLSDDENNLTKFELPGVVINGNDYVLIFLDGKGALIGNNIHTNFNIGKNGGAMFLSSSAGQIVDLVEIPTLPLDVSYGRSTDGTGTWGFFNNPTPLQSNTNATFNACLLQSPSIKLPSNTYPGQQQALVENPNSQGTIYYTLNGAEPNENSLIYTSPILIDNWNYPNNLSTIPTNPAFNYPLGTYSETRAHTRGWLPPFTDVNNISVLKVKCIANGCLSSETASASYLINQSHDLPVISLVTDSLNFFDEESGIYVYGSNATPNYDLEGFISERNVNLSYFDENGILVFSDNLGLRVAGGGSRQSTVKNLKVYWRNQYGKNKLEEKMFSELDLSVFETMLLRSGGHRPDCLPKDELGSDITRELAFEKSSYNYVHLYLNGEYWGIHSFKQKLDEDHLKNKYNIPKEDIVLLFGKNTVNNGTPQDVVDYQNMVDFAALNDLNLPANYSHIDSLMDMNNYRDYMISQIFLGNADWPNSNIKYWRKRTSINSNTSLGHDGKYRWILYDLDGTFGGSCSDVYVTFNTLEWALNPNSPFTDYTKLFRGLMNSAQFNVDFINRTCDLLNSTFLPKVTRPKSAQIKSQLDNQILDHVVRWRYPSMADSLQNRMNEIPNLVKWDYLHGKMDTFLIERPRYFRNHISNLLNLDDTSKISIDLNDPIMGKVKMNTILIDENLEGISTSTYPWQGTYFQNLTIPMIAVANPGYKFVKWDLINITTDTINVTIQGDTNFTAIFEIDTTYVAPLPLVINELQSANSSTIADENNEFDDWFEIYNPNNEPIQLNHYAFTDNKNLPTKYKFDASLTIPAKGFALFWCDNQSGQGVYHTTFKLSQAPNEFLGIYNTELNYFEDSITYPNIPENRSFGRRADGDADWVIFDEPTPFSTNIWTEEEAVDTVGLFLYPNPSSSSFIFVSHVITGKIYNMTGAYIGYIKQSQTIPIHQLSAGVYIIKTDNNIVLKFVVI